MIHVRRLTVATAVLLGLSHGPLEAQELSSAEIAAIQREVEDAVEAYYNYYYERNMQALPERVYNIPWILIGSNGVQVDLTREQALERFERSLTSLLERDWNRSVFTTVNVCVLNSGAAIASGYNTRYRNDGSVMSVGGVSYLFAKTDEGWRIVSYTGHSRDKVVRCD